MYRNVLECLNETLLHISLSGTQVKDDKGQYCNEHFHPHPLIGLYSKQFNKYGNILNCAGKYWIVMK